jgi:Glycosyl hydrolases family 28/Secretion system C-terminal sorting domain
MKYFLTLLSIVLYMNVSYAQQVFLITDFGARVGSNRNNAPQIQAAIDSASRAGGGIVRVPAGVYFTSTIFLKSNVYLEIAEGATLKGMPLTKDYPDVIPSIRTFTDEYPQRSLIYAENQSNIGIIGKGVLDGNGGSIDFLINEDVKPYGIRFHSCKNVLYEDVFLRASGFWMMHNFNCDSLTIRNVRIVNHGYGNNDGINIDACRNVLVENCSVDANNDPVVIKMTNPYFTAENIMVRNCDLATYSRAIKIGTETQGHVRNVRVENCRVDFSKAGPFGSNFPGNVGINLAIVDGGSLDDVVIQDIDIKGIKTPMTIRLGDRATLYNDTVPRPGVGTFRNLLLKNITIVAREGISSTVSGINGHPLQNIRMENVDITVAGGEDALPPGFVVPENNGAKPDNDVLGEDIPAYGIFFRNVDTLTLNNVCVKALQPDGREKYIFENISNLSGPTCGIVTAVGGEREDFSGVFPNPANDIIRVQSPFVEYTCRLLNAAGQLMYEQSFLQPTVQIPVSDFPAGIYFIQLSTQDGESVISKWMKR